MQKTEAPLEQVTKKIIGACVEDIEVTLLLEEDDIMSVPIDVIQRALPNVEESDIEAHILGLCKPTATITCSFRSNDLIEINF